MRYLKAYSPQEVESFHVDLHTRNTSALKMAVLLNSMGVKNCYFHLRLNNKNLQGVDPYDPDLTTQQKLEVFRECSENRWYFYREVFRVPENGSGTGIGGGSEFVFNRGNLACLWANSLNLSTYFIMPRQTGKTWTYLADGTYTYQFNRGSTILHFNKTQKDANDNLQRIKAAIRMLPAYLQHSSEDNLEPSEKRLVKNAEKSMRNAIGSTIEAMASAGNEAKADALARGKTASKIWYDELSYIFFNEIIYSAATPAYERAKESAIKHGAPYGISISTTPGDLATPHGAFAYRMMNDCIRFDESFYDLSKKKLTDRMERTPDKMSMLFMQFSYLQLGLTDEWYLEIYKDMNNPIRARREYLLEWMNSNGNSPFDPDDIDLISDLTQVTRQKKEIVRINKYFTMSVYDHYYGKKPVLIGVDVAGSIGRDSSAIVVANPDTLKPIAIFKSNMIELSALRKLITTIVKKMYPHCILTIERNSVGKGLIDELRDTPVSRVLYKERGKRTIDKGANSIVRKRTVDTIEYGHLTSTQTRPQMMEILETLVHNSPAHVAYEELYEEIRFLELKNGRIDHGSATHDDVVMAYMGLLWVVRYGNGLKGKGIYYNIRDGSDGYEEMEYDNTSSYRTADKLLQGKRNKQEDFEEDLVDYMRREHHVQTAAALAERERAEYMRALDERDGVLDDDELDISVSKRTQELLTANYNAMLHADFYGHENDPIADLLRPENALGYEGEESWATAYKW